MNQSPGNRACDVVSSEETTENRKVAEESATEATYLDVCEPRFLEHWLEIPLRKEPDVRVTPGSE